MNIFKCDNCPIVWNSPDFKKKISVSEALFIISQYTITDFDENDICRECPYIDYTINRSGEVLRLTQ